MRISPLLVILSQIVMALMALYHAYWSASYEERRGIVVSVVWIVLAFLSLVIITVAGGGWPIQKDGIKQAWETLFIGTNGLVIFSLWLASRNEDASRG